MMRDLAGIGIIFGGAMLWIEVALLMKSGTATIIAMP